MTLADVSDYRCAARRRLPRFLFDYIDGGSYAEQTLAWNTEDLQSLCVRQHVMRDVSSVDIGTRLFGREVTMPLALAPVGLAGLYARRGEAQAARAAEGAGVPFSLSTLSVCSIEEVAAASDTPPWFQLYMIKDRGFMRELLIRARAAGCETLLLTVDLQTPGARYRDMRSGFSGEDMASGLRRLAAIVGHPEWSIDVGLRGRPHTLGNVASVMPRSASLQEFWRWVGGNFDLAVTWKDIDWVRQTWDGSLVVKGVLEVCDARAAVAAGADGIVVSNHGGRQLDGVASSISVLPEIAQAVGSEMTVLMDGGVRSGLDVLRALASGAKGVLIGRAWAYALAAAGGDGVAQMLAGLRKELTTAMILSGATRIDQLDESYLRLPRRTRRRGSPGPRRPHAATGGVRRSPRPPRRRP